MQGAYLSYGGPDEDFARRLAENLRAFGLRVFFFPDSAQPGRKLHRAMRVGITEADIAILICSESSLNRPGVLNEIEECLAKEARLGGREILIPITLDDYVLTDWAPDRSDIAQAVRDRVVADFRFSTADDVSYRHGILKLRDTLHDIFGELPDVEVLGGIYTVTIEDRSGRSAILLYEKLIRPVVDNPLTLDLPNLTASGRIEVIDCNLGPIRASIDEGGKRRLEFVPDPPLKRGEVYNFVVRMQALDCYTEEVETASFQPDRAYPYLSIKVNLPSDRPAQSCTLRRIRERDRTEIPGDYVLGRGEQLFARVDWPYPGAQYVLEWAW